MCRRHATLPSKARATRLLVRRWLGFGIGLRLTSRSAAGADRTVTDHCGEVYKDCDICRVHPCQYHYNPTGMDAQAKVVAAAFRANLKKKRAVE